MRVEVGSPPCPRCRKITPVEVDLAAYRKWCDGAIIQDVMPELSADDREALISGTCSECWKAMFLGEE